MLASAVGPNLTKLLHDQLDLFFACGPPEPLRQALVAIARNIPPLLKTIQGESMCAWRSYEHIVRSSTGFTLNDIIQAVL